MTENVYDGYAYGDLGYPELFQHLLPLLKHDQSALDLGIGTGHESSVIAFAGLHITGVDRNPFLLGACREAYDEAEIGSQLTLVEMDALKYMRANSAKYDLVILSDFLMFLTKTDGKEILRLAYEALEASGYIWITTMSTGDDFYARMKHQREIDKETFMSHSHCGGSGPACFYFPGEIEAFLVSLGAKVVFGIETLNSSDGMFNIVLAQKPE